MRKNNFFIIAAILLATSCVPDDLDTQFVKTPIEDISLSSMAKIISDLPIEAEHLVEVYDAVASSSSNGYDEEYMMRDLLNSPGKGVGEKGTKASRNYQRPLRDVLAEYLSEHGLTRSGTLTRSGAEDVEEILNNLSLSDMQIYWPYSENWDGETFPIITYDPGFGAETNYGYIIAQGVDGYSVVDSVLVTESLAQERPIWVINRNYDSYFTPLKQYISSQQDLIATSSAETESEPIDSKATEGKALYIRSFKMMQHYDSWFGGASEFFIKCGAIDGFKAKTEEEIRLYSPQLTDLMVVIKRSQKGVTVPVNTLLLSEYTEQMDKMAFLITEDDGGKTESWKCNAVVKLKSKSFGFELEIPYKDRDDIVWRGQLSHSFFGDKSITTATLGGVAVVFEQK